jgi:hypothetical protein
MSCNCPTPNQCPPSELCLCGVTLSIFNPEGILVETIQGNIFQGEGDYYYVVTSSTAFNGILPTGYELTISYNYDLERWEMTYYNEELDLNILLGVLYGVPSTDCPVNNCWDLDCNAVAFNVLGVFNTYFPWTGEYTNGKKSYTFSSNWSGPIINYRIYWTPDSSTIPDSGAPVGTPAWILEQEEVPNVWKPDGFLFNDNPCLYGQYITQFEGLDTRFSFEDLGVTGFDMKSVATDCGCCDESVVIDITFDDIYYPDVVANVVTDEYGNVLAFNGYQYYSFELQLTPTPATFYLFYSGAKWIMSDSLDGNIYTELLTDNSCPFGPYTFYKPVTSFSVIGSECFDCCDYDVPSNRNLLKKKKLIFVKEIASIRNKELFGLKCGTDWEDLYKKHLIFDVLWCLPYGTVCDEDQQCLINKLSENCNC